MYQFHPHLVKNVIKRKQHLYPYAPYLVLSDGARPTEDLYFRHTTHFLNNRGITCQFINAQAHSPFWTPEIRKKNWKGSHAIITRSLPYPWVKWLSKHRSELGKLFYLLDDDFDAAARDPRLPAKYRKRMGRFIDKMQPALFSLVDEVVVCSSVLQERLRDIHPKVSLLMPSLISPLPNLDHHETEAIEIGFYGTRAHLADFEQIVPAINSVLHHFPRSMMEVMLGRYTPQNLAPLEQVRMPNPLGWDDFLRYQRSHRIHIGLAPLWPTPFNEAKSWIKFLDISVMGGVGIYSNRPPYSEIVENGIDGLLVEDSTKDWEDALAVLVQHPQQRLEMAQNAANKAKKIGDTIIAQQFWFDRASE